MRVVRSSKYNSKRELWHNDRRVTLSRAWGGLAFHGVPKFLVIVGEEIWLNEPYYYILAEAQASDGEHIPDLVRVAKRMEAEYRVTRWFGRKDSNVEQILAICNKTMYNDGIRNLVVQDSARLGEHIDESVSITLDLTSPSDKRLFFFSESTVPAELRSLPSVDIRADHFPRATALSNVVAGLRYHAYEQFDSSLLEPEWEAPY